MSIKVLHGDCLTVLPTLDADSLDSCVTDPPYHLTTGKRGGSGAASLNLDSPAGRARVTTGFMGKAWDGGDVATRPETWAAVLRVLKPGAHLVAFGGTRTFHRMMCAIEDAGFEIRDTLAWLYGSGFPKSHDVAKSIDKAERGVPHGGIDPTSPNHGKFKTQATEGKRSDADNGQGFGAGPGQFMASAGAIDERELCATARRWSGWGTALKPAYEPIILARKPLIGTVAANVLAHGTGAINVDACRVPTDPAVDDARLGGKGTWNTDKMAANAYGKFAGSDTGSSPLGRWPANVVHDGSEEVLAGFPDRKTTWVAPSHANNRTGEFMGALGHPGSQGFNDNGSAARFFYTAKADAADRLQSKHPTVKPVDLICWLTRLVTPPGGTILDCFAGSGTTATAALAGGFNAILIEREVEYVADIRRRLDHVSGADTPLFTHEVGTTPRRAG